MGCKKFSITYVDNVLDILMYMYMWRLSKYLVSQIEKDFSVKVIFYMIPVMNLHSRKRYKKNTDIKLVQYRYFKKSKDQNENQCSSWLQYFVFYVSMKWNKHAIALLLHYARALKKSRLQRWKSRFFWVSRWKFHFRTRMTRRDASYK